MKKPSRKPAATPAVTDETQEIAPVRIDDAPAQSETVQSQKSAVDLDTSAAESIIASMTSRIDDVRQERHVADADAPTVDIETHVPGSRVEQRRMVDEGPKKNALVRLFALMREGLNPDNLKSSYGRKPLYLLMGVGIVGIFGARASSLALPEIQRDFELNIGAIIDLSRWIGLLGTLLIVPLGYLGDRSRRVTLYGLGSVFASVGTLFTGLAPGKAGLYLARSANEVGDLGPNAVGFSLIADYVPQEYRGQSYAFRAGGRAIGGIIAPLFVGVVGSQFGWRVPFIIVGIIGIVFGLWFTKMPEPIRGYHERKAWGADEEISRRQQEPPSWGEAFRAAWGVRTLRRYAYAEPFRALSTNGFAIFYPLYLARSHNVTLGQRGIIGAIAAFAGLLGLTIGGPLVDKIIGRNPGRVVMISGGASAIVALSYIPIAFAPNAAIAVTIGVLVTLFDSIIEPASVAVTSMVIPPRVRNLGIATLAYWTIPTFFAFSAVAGLAGNSGFRATILVFVPFAVIASIIYMTAGPYVEFDIRSAAAAAMATEEWRRARTEGRAKLLVLRDVDVHYESVQVLFGVDLDIEQGDLIALLGTNGAGKSTILRAISGTQEASGGAIVFDGRDITHVPPHEIAGYGIAQTPGGRGIFPGLTVRENLQLAGWLYGQDPKHKDELQVVFTYFPILRDRMEQLAGSLSGGEQQMLTLAQAFLSRPKLLMIDELSLGLSPAIVEQLLNIVRAIHERGTTILIVEQSVNVALTVAKRAIFMEKGEVRFDGPTEELLARPDIMRAVFLKGGGGGGALGVGVGGAGVATMRDEDRADMLVVRDVVKSYGGVRAVDEASLVLREQEAIGLIGPNGAGKTTLLEIISGFNPPDGGQVVYQGRDITFASPDERAKVGIIRRFQDAKLFPSLTVAETIAIAFEQQVEVRSMVVQSLGLPQARQSETSIRRKVDRLIELLNLEAFREKFIGEVSTGTRRIVDIACVLAAEPRLLLLDEPSSGLAQREAENMAPLLNQVRRETGCSLLIIEHDLPLISAVSDELIFMELGRTVLRDTPEKVLSNERVIQAYLGGAEEIIQRSGRIKKETTK